MTLKKFFHNAGINPLVLLLPTLLALAAALFEGISFGLLIPTIKGIIQGNANFAKEIPLLNSLVRTFPQIFENRNAAILPLLVGLIFAAAILKNAFQYASMVGIAYQAKEFSNRMRKLIYQRYLKFGKLFFDQHNAGHLHQILTFYTTQVAEQLSVFNHIFYSVFALAIYLALMFAISRPLTVFVMVVSPVLHYSVDWLIRKIKKSSETYAESYNHLAKNISNALSCIPLVKAYTSEKKEEEWFAYASERVRSSEFSIDKKKMLIGPLQDMVLLSLILVLVGLMAFLLIRHKSGNLAGYMVFFVLLRRSAIAFGSLSQIRAALASLKGPASEIMRIFDDEDKYFIPEGRLRFTGLKERIEFNRLNFSYPQGVQALKDIAFSIEKGKTTALVGPSGAGKSTLIHLIMRFYDSPPGTLQIDGTDIRDFTLESLRRKMALVSQETLLFNASFRMNLNYGLEEKTPSEIGEALEKARLGDLIRKLPQGLETEIGDRGVKLSGGEKQRLSIARAILKKPEIFILDEATSALDTRTEALIQAAIDDAIQGRTAVVIAHRLSTIKNADRIVVVEEGRLLEEGSLQELLEKRGRFAQYWEAQKFY